MPLDEHGEYWDYISSTGYDPRWPPRQQATTGKDPAGGIRGDPALPLGRITVSQYQPEPERVDWAKDALTLLDAKGARLREYIVITRSSTVLLEQWINHLLTEGWAPIGGVAVSKGSFYQAMGR